MAEYIVQINRVVIAWNSRSHKTVTLSVTEAECSEITEVCYKILFVYATLLFMEVVVKYPITVCVDNVEDILLSKNTSSSQRTKHIDVRQYFICNYVEDRTVKNQFLRS